MNTPNTVYTGPFFAFDWRDFHYFAQLDEAQVDAGIELTLDICRRHDIEPSFYTPLRRRLPALLPGGDDRLPR